MAKFKIKEVFEEEDHEVILNLHRSVLESDSLPDCSIGWWWLVFAEDGEAVGFAGLHPSSKYKDAGYLARVGVVEKARGHGLQTKLIRVRERKARKLGYLSLVTDTTANNTPSSNNLIKCKYVTFNPSKPWSLKNSVYWHKYL